MDHKMDPSDRALIDLARHLSNDVLPTNKMEARRVIQEEVGVGAISAPAKYGVLDPDIDPSEHRTV